MEIDYFEQIWGEKVNKGGAKSNLKTMRRKEKIQYVLERLAKEIPEPETELEYGDPWQLLVAVVLSAQCTDKRVNMTTPALFEAFPGPAETARADFDTLFPYIKSISFPANKTRHILKTATIVIEQHGGQVPRAFDDLIKLPGVGRKTANVVTSVLYGEPRLAVDTHVHRVANRIGIARAKDVLKTEEQLTKAIPPEQIPDAHHYLILHGRYRCTARKPGCEGCSLTEVCGWYRKNRKL